MIKSERALIIKKILDDTYPRTPVPLDHKDTYTLLIAVLLSAQCTDERVNQITPALFKLAPNPKKMSQMSVEKIYEIIKPCGLGPQKSNRKITWSWAQNCFCSYEPRFWNTCICS